MSQLASLQAAIAHSMLAGDAGLAPTTVVGGADSRARIDIHLRHYAVSLRNALLEKFPATTWLLGSELIASAASAYTREHPPEVPCIAEYGREFPSFVARFGRAGGLPYLESFGRLEWAVGRASIAVDETPMRWTDVANAGPERLLDARVMLQQGLRHLRATHGVDELMRLFLEALAPEMFSMEAGEVFIEVYGSRGSSRITRLDPAIFVFRGALHAGDSISGAAGRALELDERFDPGGALRALFDAGLVVQIRFQ